MKTTLWTNPFFTPIYETRPLLHSVQLCDPHIDQIISNLERKASTDLLQIYQYIGDIESVLLSVLVFSKFNNYVPEKFPTNLKWQKSDHFTKMIIASSYLYYLSPKVFDRIAYDQLYDYSKTNELLFIGHYGFRKHHSTELVKFNVAQ